MNENLHITNYTSTRQSLFPISTNSSQKRYEPLPLIAKALDQTFQVQLPKSYLLTSTVGSD